MSENELETMDVVAEPTEAVEETTEAAPKAKKAPKEPVDCACGAYEVLVGQRDAGDGEVEFDEELTTNCDGAKTKSIFAPGHDARLKSLLIKAGALGEHVRFNNPADGLLHEVTPVEAAGRYGFADMVESGIAKAKEKADARVAAAAAKAVKKAAADKAKADKKAEREAAKAAKDAAKVKAASTSAVRDLLSVIPDGSEEAIAAKFLGSDATAESFAKSARGWLGDKTEVTTDQLANADWEEIFTHFSAPETVDA